MKLLINWTRSNQSWVSHFPQSGIRAPAIESHKDTTHTVCLKTMFLLLIFLSPLLWFCFFVLSWNWVKNGVWKGINLFPQWPLYTCHYVPPRLPPPPPFSLPPLPPPLSFPPFSFFDFSSLLPWKFKKRTLSSQSGVPSAKGVSFLIVSSMRHHCFSSSMFCLSLRCCLWPQL